MFTSPFVIFFALFLSIPLLFLFGPTILPPGTASLSDDLDDRALFHRATTRRPNPRVRVGTTNPNPKIAFLFLTNSDLTFAPIWEQFFHQNQNLYNIYIHADPTVEFTPPGGVFRGRLIAAKKTERSSPTLIAAARRLLAAAVIDDPMNLYFALVSQHCVPIHSFRYIYTSLFGSSLAAIRAFSTQSRHTSFIEILANEPNLMERYTARGENVMLPEVPFEHFRTGSQFFVLAKRHAVVVLRDRKLWRKFKLPCLNVDSCYPEEHYFPTLLSMKDPEGCSGFTLTRVNWTDSADGHPHTYLPEELSPELVHNLRESNSSYSYFFARKFSSECLTPLMELADKVLFRD